MKWIEKFPMDRDGYILSTMGFRDRLEAPFSLTVFKKIISMKSSDHLE